MIVFILRAVDFESSATLAVFATRELADAAVVTCKAWLEKYATRFAAEYAPEDFDKWMTENPPPYDALGYICVESFRIEEFSVTGAE